MVLSAKNLSSDINRECSVRRSVEFKMFWWMCSFSNAGWSLKINVSMIAQIENWLNQPENVL